MASDTDDRLTVLFLCTGNSARSILAEAMMNHPAIGGGRFRAFSAGSHPKGEVDAMALEVLAQDRVSTDGLRSKSWEKFAGPGAIDLHFVFTVCEPTAVRSAGATVMCATRSSQSPRFGR